MTELRRELNRQLVHRHWINPLIEQQALDNLAMTLRRKPIETHAQVS
jgi:hypothetical protein